MQMWLLIRFPKAHFPIVIPPSFDLWKSSHRIGLHLAEVVELFPVVDQIIVNMIWHCCSLQCSCLNSGGSSQAAWHKNGETNVWRHQHASCSSDSISSSATRPSYDHASGEIQRGSLSPWAAFVHHKIAIRNEHACGWQVLQQRLHSSKFFCRRFAERSSSGYTLRQLSPICTFRQTLLGVWISCHTWWSLRMKEVCATFFLICSIWIRFSKHCIHIVLSCKIFQLAAYSCKF